MHVTASDSEAVRKILFNPKMIPDCFENHRFSRIDDNVGGNMYITLIKIGLILRVFLLLYKYTDGGCRQAVKTKDCGSFMRGFESHHPPHLTNLSLRRLFL